ncbi:MAG: trigger factor [Flavobacteriales bacterium]|nr:trigger factor [Flavobacteriales bacterium]
MDVSVNKIDALNAVLTVKISSDDYKSTYESSLKNHRKQMQLPGFRKGHVPTSIIKKKYGPSILAEEIDKILNKSIYDHITENKLNILGNPLPIEDEKIKIDWNQPSDFEFKYELGLAPEILPDLPGRLKYTKYQPKINEALIDKQIDDFARRYGKLTSIEKAGERDMIMSNFKELDQSGNVVVDGFNQSSTVSLEFITDKKTKKKLIGCKPTDTFQLDPKKISRGEADMAAMLGIDKEKAKHYINDVLMTVNEVKTLEPANIDVVLFDKIYGAGEAKNEQEFRAKVNEDLNKMFVADIDRLLKNEISTNLIKKLKIKLPDNFLKKWILSSNKEAKKEDIEKEYDRYAEGLKWQLIENFIIKDQELKVDGEELLNFTMELMGNQYVQYGMMIPEEDELKKTAQKVLSNNEEARKINDMIYDKKVMEYLKNTLKINDKFISHEDFTKKVAELSQ